MKRVCLLILILFFISCTNDSIRFALFSDTHVAENTSGAADLRLAVQDVNSLAGIDFVLVSGDITDMNIGNNLRLAKQILDCLTMPYYIIPGNHDSKWSGSAGANFRVLWGDDKFIFDSGGYCFIGFHQGPVLRMDDGHIPREDLKWLKNQLGQTGTEKPVILVMHYALTSSIDNWHECIDIIKDYNIKAIIHGHGHRSRLNNYQGIPGFMGRSTLRAQEERGGFNIFELQNDSLIARERMTGGPTGEAWAGVDLSARKRIQPVTDSLLADLPINKQFPDIQTAWIFESGYTTTASPVIADSLVYIGNVSGQIQAISLNTGIKQWSVETNGAIYGTAATYRDYLVFNSADSFIYCIAKNDQSLKWKYKTNAGLVSVPIIADDIVYSGASDGIFRAIDIESGELIWEYTNVGSFVETKPLLYKDKIIFGAWDGKLYALNKINGAEAWIWQGGKPGPLYAPAACWPVAAHGKIFIAAPDRFASAIDANNGQSLWRNNNWKFRETVGISENGDYVFARSMTDSVVCFDARTNRTNVVWAKNFGYGYDIAPSMPIEKDGTLFWGTKNGLLTAADAQNGAILWQYKMDNYLINTVAPVSKREVVFSNIDGKIGKLVFGK